MINKYSLGGQLLRNVLKGITKGELSYKGINGVANSFSKRVPELKNLLNKLANSTKSSTKLGEAESKRLVELINQHRGNFRSLDKIIPARLRRTYPVVPIQASGKASGKAEEKIAQQVERELASSIKQGALGTPKRGHYLPKETITYSVAPELRNTLKHGSRAARPTVPTSPTTVTETAAPAVEAVTPVTTISGRWAQLKNWLNNHPTTALGGALFLGSGTGRDLLGKGFDLYSARPFSGNEQPANTEVISINGQDIPIKRGADGKWVVNDQPDEQTAQQSPTDDIDAIISQANSQADAQAGVVDPSGQVPSDMLTQQQINDLFDDDQW